MRQVFADSNYWLAICWPNDPWRAMAGRARAALGTVRLITTEEVLTECLNAFAADRHLRERGVAAVHAIFGSTDVHVVSQSHESFMRGFQLYERRRDKAYSLTDCISMSLMKLRGIREVLTNDHHFTQEGFHVLMRVAE